MKQRRGVDEDAGLTSDPEAPHAEEFAAAARCAYCGDGMARDVFSRFNRGYGTVVLLLGILLSLFMSLLLGLPMVVIGAYMVAAIRPVWMCRACGAVVDRTGT